MYIKPIKGNVFFISDMEFGRESIIENDRRPFSSLKEMEKVIVAKWNKKVTSEDTVIIVGDFCENNPELANRLLDELNGKKILVVGNNDNYLNSDLFDSSKYSLICDLLEVNIGDYSIIATHYPMADWVSRTRGKIHVHGHVHGYPEGCDMVAELGRMTNRYNASVTENGYEPMSVYEFIKKYGYDKEYYSLENIKKRL